jgi:hypothetical protein
LNKTAGALIIRSVVECQVKPVWNNPAYGENRIPDARPPVAGVMHMHPTSKGFSLQRLRAPQIIAALFDLVLRHLNFDAIL